MSFSKEKQEAIREYILQKIDDREDNVASKTMEAFGISENTYHRYLRQLREEHILERNEEGKGYHLVCDEHRFAYPLSKDCAMSDDAVYIEDIVPLLGDLPANVISMWDYCFSEMMNNVLEHADATQVQVIFSRNYLYTTITMIDDGVGIFKKIRDYFHYTTLDDAILELFKGKLTTDSENHSGEGIFFTSRLCDRFAILSGGKFFSQDHYHEILRDVDGLSALEKLAGEAGTVVLMRISDHSKKMAAEIFDRFADVDGGFTRTRIPLKNIYERYPVSRSQAKRLADRFEDFEEVELDFEGIEQLGQGFAHQLFVVWQRQHPLVTLIPVNTQEHVQKMISHVLHS